MQKDGSIEIRRIKEGDDRLAISHVYEASWKSAYQGIVPQAYLDGIPKGRWAQAVDDPAWHTLVMLEGGGIIGTSSYAASRYADMQGYGEIISIYLLPEYMGKGYGKALLLAAIEGLERLGYKDIFLWVLEENEKARGFYERWGFFADGACLDIDIGGKGLREVRYIRPGH